MDDTLDHFDVGNRNFKTATIILKCMMVCFTALALFIFIARVFPQLLPVNLNRYIIVLLGIGPMLVMVLLAPIGLFFII